MIELLGYIDRIEDNKHAVIIVETESKQFVVDADTLPTGVTEGKWVDFKLNQYGEVSEITLNKSKQNKMTTEVNNVMNQLRSKKKESKFKRK